MSDEASELSIYETASGNNQVAPVVWSLEKYKVAELLALSSKTKTAISKETNIPVTVINKWLQHPEFKEYVNNIVTTAAKEVHTELMKLKMKVIAARVEEAELNGYSTLTNKDTLDVMAEVRKDTSGDKTQDSSYTNLLEKLVMNSLHTQPKTIVVEDVHE